MFFKDQAVEADQQKHHHQSQMGDIQKNNESGRKIGSGQIPDHQQTATDQNAGQHGDTNPPAGRHASRIAIQH